MAAKIITVFSTKGGVGKTLIALNLAIAISKQNKKVCLIDLDLQAPHMFRMANLEIKHSIFSLSAKINEAPERFHIKDYTINIKPDVDFLSGVSHPRQSPKISTQILGKLFEIVSKEYEYVIIDAGKVFSDVIIYTLDHTNLILYVVTPDVLSVYETRWSIDTLQTLNFPLKMIKLLLNRAESKGGFSWQEIKVALPCDIIANVPSEGKVVGMAVNRGVPLILDSPKSKISDAVTKLASDIITKNSLFISPKEVTQLRTKIKDQLPKAGAFWEKFRLEEEFKKTEASPEDEVIKLKQHIHTKLVQRLDLKRQDLGIILDPKRAKELGESAKKITSDLLAEETSSFISSHEVRQRFIKEIIDEALGLGPLEDLLIDPEITDIMVNNKDEVYVEKDGKLELTSKKFISNDQVRVIIERIIAPLGRRIDESTPMVDARLPNGSRVNAIIPPLSLTGPMLTIRKFRQELLTVDDLIDKYSTLNRDMAEFLRACVLSRRNMIISGGTGSGKTTLLNILSQYIPGTERIVTIEDAAELRLNQENWGRLEARPSNIEGKGSITVRDLFRNTLRMRPDRIIIGECRGPEVLDMLQAMNTGHDGSMTTVHANSTQDVLVRLDSMILMSGVELPMRAIREMLASAVDLIVHTARLSDGSRKVIQITELTGMSDELHIGTKDVFMYKQTGVDKNGKAQGNFIPTGYIPSFVEEINLRGISLSEEIFKPSKK